MWKRTVDISGFGGGYEAMCQTLLWRGIAYLAEVKPPLEMWKDAKSYRGVYGILQTEGKDLTALEEAIIRPGDDVTRVMHQAVMEHLYAIHTNGLDGWLAEYIQKAPGRVVEVVVNLFPVDSHHEEGGLEINR